MEKIIKQITTQKCECGSLMYAFYKVIGKKLKHIKTKCIYCEGKK